MTGPGADEDINAEHLHALVGRVLSDPQFARALEADPVAALQAEGVLLDQIQIDALRQRAELAADERERVDPELGIPTTRPAVRILTHGTHPVVSVLVDTHIPHVEEADRETPAPPSSGPEVPPGQEQPPEETR